MPEKRYPHTRFFDMNDALSAFRCDSEMLAVRDLPWGLSRHRSLACWLDCLRHLLTDLQCLCTLNDMVTNPKVYGRKHKGERDRACSSRSKTTMVTVTMGRVKLDTILRVVNKRVADKLLP